jgi:O-antigen/teichoic acid export membrane protein
MLDLLRNNIIFRRIAAGTGANLLGKIWIFLSQIVTIPLLTHNWGADGYGLWLLLTTLPAYILLGDFGIASALAVSISGALARGDTLVASNLLRTGWLLLTGLVVSIAVLGMLGGWWLIAASGAWHATNTDPIALALSLAAMSLYAVAIAEMNLVNAIYRATYRYALGTVFLDALIPIELIAIVAVVLAGGGILSASAALLLVRSIGLVLYYRRAAKLEPWVWQTGRFSMDAFRSLLHPSLATFSLTLANTFTFHALILAVGMLAGPAAVGAFGAARVLTRAPLQFSGLLSRAAVPELTRAALNNDHKTVRRVLFASTGTALLVAGPSFALVVLGGQWALHFLTGSTLSAPIALVVALSLAATLNAVWSSTSVLLIALNKQASFTHAYAALCGLGVAATLFLPTGDVALTAAIAMAAAEGATLVVVILATFAVMKRDRHAG